MENNDVVVYTQKLAGILMQKRVQACKCQQKQKR